MSIYLVRHAKAGSRSHWEGDDKMRPLSKSGWKQAEAIAEHLANHSPTALFSSPFVRCRQTLEPLANEADLEIVLDRRLGEARSFEGALEMLAEVPDGAVLCSHGDVIPETMAALERRGCQIVSEPDWRKGTVWTLDRGIDGNFERAEVWSPPN